MSNFNSRKQYKNPLEALREIGRETIDSMKNETLEISRVASEQITRKIEGELTPGESLEMKEVVTYSETETRYKEQLVIERQLREEDQFLIEKRTNELRIQIKAIHEEIIRLAEVTPRLTQEVEIAAFQAPADPSAYELFFLERLFEFIRSFRKKIEDANIWLEASNHRARKRNVWGAHYKKYGAKYLLSGEHYASRSAA